MENKGKIKFFHYLNTGIELVISENSHHSYPLHNHVSVFIIGMVLNGEIKLKIAEKSYNYKLRQIFIIPPYISHRISLKKMIFSGSKSFLLVLKFSNSVEIFK